MTQVSVTGLLAGTFPAGPPIERQSTRLTSCQTCAPPIFASHGDPLTGTFESEDAEGQIVVRTQGNKLLTLKLAPAEESGDQTVPAKASAEAVGGVHFRQSGYDHQNSYKDDKVLASALYSIVKIANTATWWDK